MHVFLETDRLVLSRFTEADADNLVDLDGNREVIRIRLLGGRGEVDQSVPGLVPFPTAAR